MPPSNKAEQAILTGTPVSAVVYIWYPCHRFPVGHAAIYIGGVPKCPWSIGITEFPTQSTSVQRPSLPQDNNYVSFMGDSNVFRGTISVQGILNNTQSDFKVHPHMEYYLIGLDVEKMQAKKNEIYNGKRYGNHQISHSYNPINKNCATMVASILKAGGVENSLTPVQNIGYGKNIYWTPKDIAQLCNELRNNDLAVKIRDLDCPDKFKSPIKTIMGFR
ncbi:hypothetical protein [Xenorhabdus innexi]|uniref:RTX toxin n=1 Tax=Xenorhabdus innexi TaxID=290109 RepID=A0A1N6MSK4_9GAMM|nr:hypothetical protein [Xenorhabdus innexi]PHM36330.1 RTX toxin [Xenorhabdus innexi]SIP71754.1 hypothetical protein XIS1_1260005 [Xenorhabdus innexi]